MRFTVRIKRIQIEKEEREGRERERITGEIKFRRR